MLERERDKERGRERAREIVCVCVCECVCERDGERYVRECKHARETFAIIKARIPQEGLWRGGGKVVHLSHSLEVNYSSRHSTLQTHGVYHCALQRSKRVLFLLLFLSNCSPSSCPLLFLHLSILCPSRAPSLLLPLITSTMKTAMTAHRNAAFFLVAATIAQIIASANGLRELLGDGVCNSTFCKLQLDGGLNVGVVCLDRALAQFPLWWCQVNGVQSSYRNDFETDKGGTVCLLSRIVFLIYAEKRNTLLLGSYF